MKKASTPQSDQNIPELKCEKLGVGVRGKYLKQIRQGSNVVVLQSEIQKAFPTSEAINKALASMLVFAQETQEFAVQSKRHSRKQGAGSRSNPPILGNNCLAANPPYKLKCFP